MEEPPTHPHLNSSIAKGRKRNSKLALLTQAEEDDLKKNTIKDVAFPPSTYMDMEHSFQPAL